MARGRTGLPCIAVLAGGIAALGASAAPEVGRSDFVYVSDLAAAGYEPFAVSGAGALFGMKSGADMYLCFSLDTEDAAAERREVLLQELAGTLAARALPNLPVVCILTQ